MTLLSTLTVKLLGDIQDFKTKMSEAENTMKNAGHGMQSAGLKLSAAVTAPIVGIGVASLGAASDLEESRNKVNVVFDDMAGTITDFSSDAAVNLGLTQQAALEYLGTFGNLFDSMGIGQDVNADMSTSLLTLAADLASFNNIDPTLALEKLRAGLVGEVEPLRTLGVNLNADLVKAKAFQMGLVELAIDQDKVTAATSKVTIAQQELTKAMAEGDPLKVAKAQEKLRLAEEGLAKTLEGTPDKLTAAAKAQAAYAIIMEQTANAQGDFMRTSDGLANSQRILKAQFGDMLATLGQELLPIAMQVVGVLRGWLDKLTAMDPEQRKLILVLAGVAAAIGPVLLIVGSLVGAIGSIVGVIGPVLAAIGAVVGVLSGPVLLVIALVVGAVALLAAAWQNNWGGIQEKTQAVVDWIKTHVQAFLDNIRAWWDAHGSQVMAVVRGIWDGIRGVFETVFKIIKKIWEAWSLAFQGDWRGFGEKLREAWDMLWEAIKTAASKAWDGIKTFFTTLVSNIWKILTETDWLALGKNIITGIVDGLISMDQWLRSKIIDIAKNALDAFKGFFGIESPSRVMAGMGAQMIAGLTQGLQPGRAVAAMRDLYSQMASQAAAMPALQLGSMALAPSGDMPALGPMARVTPGGHGGGTTYETNYLVNGTFRQEEPEDLVARLRLLSLMEGR